MSIISWLMSNLGNCQRSKGNPDIASSAAPLQFPSAHERRMAAPRPDHPLQDNKYILEPKRLCSVWKTRCHRTTYFWEFSDNSPSAPAGLVLVYGTCGWQDQLLRLVLYPWRSLEYLASICREKIVGSDYLPTNTTLYEHQWTSDSFSQRTLEEIAIKSVIWVSNVLETRSWEDIDVLNMNSGIIPIRLEGN